MVRSQMTCGDPSLTSVLNFIRGTPVSRQRRWVGAEGGSQEDWALGFTLSLSTVQLL